MTLSRPLGLRLLLGALCFASGVAGLTYEVVWHRLLAVVLGNASFATAAVLAAVMGGMGLGALWVGRRADRLHPLRLYAFLELGLGAVALTVPSLSTAAADWTVPLLRVVGPGWPSFAVRFVIAGVVVLVPAFLLGATLPALARSAELVAPRGPDRVGRSVGAIYALNTAGAALGCALTGYWLIGAWGVRATSATAAVVDLSVGALALVLSMTVAARLPEPTDTEDEDEPASLPRPLVLALAFVIGLVVLGLETVWARVFRIVFGHDVHAFSAMLAAVLLGLAIGSATYRALPARLRAHPGLVPTLLVSLGAAALLALGWVGHGYLDSGIDVLGVGSALSVTRSESRGIVLQAVFAALTILTPAVAAGALFPALCARHPGAAAGERTGRVLAANTAGTLVGPLLTALVLVPWLGIIGAALVLAATIGLAGAALLLRHPRRASPKVWAGALVAAGVLALATLTTPPSLTQRILARKIGPAHLDFEHYEEGRSATVAVVHNRINGERQLFVNGINEVTTRLVHDQSFALLGHIGPLLHPEPERVGVICLGAGLSAGAAARHPVDEVTIVDLEPAVEGGARRFEAMNYAVLDDPRTTLVIDDGRAHLRTVEEPYDVVVLDSTHPRAVDSWILYTREFYRLAKEALADDGILVQWLPLHGLSVDEFRVLVGTFRETFEDATMWTNVGFEPYGQVAYAQLVGSRRGDLSVDAEALARRLQNEQVHASLEPWGLASVAEILECLHAGPETLARWSQGLPVNTDDHPLTQFVTRYTASAPMTPDRLLEAFEPRRAPYDPPLEAALAEELERRWEAQGLMLAGRLGRATEVCGPGCAKPPMFAEAMGTGPDYYRALAELYPGEADRSLEVARGLASHGLGDEALAVLEEAAEGAPDDFALALHLGLLRASRGDAEGAAAAHREAVAIDPERAIGHLNLGLARLAQGQVGRALVSLERAVALDPSLAAAHAGLGYAWMHRHDAGERPERSLREALRLDPRHRDARANLGQLLLRRDRPDEAVTVLRSAYRYHPYDADMLFDLALAHRAAGASVAARRDLARVLAIDPSDAEARALLAELTRE